MTPTRSKRAEVSALHPEFLELTDINYRNLRDQTLRLWDIMRGMAGEVLTGHTAWVTSVYERIGNRWKLVHRHADPITTARPEESMLGR